ncbi:MAG: sulfatase-like hydrolase/transferase [Desulfobacterales bacterium]|nr:sulfatase-like hydrolase/transferase [Desulfobacterales bacterium]
MGFEYFYGFVGGDASQWQPNLFRNTTPIYPVPGQARLEPDHGDGRRGDPVHEADQGRSRPTSRSSSITCPAARMRRTIRRQEWIDKISDMHLFDDGWNKLRETIFANQKRLGIMPGERQADALAEGHCPKPGTQLSADGEEALHQAGGGLSPPTLAYTDHEIGRVIQAVEDLGQLDNTLIIYISGDNGASAEGMLNGTPNEFTTFNGVAVPVKDQFLWYDVLGLRADLPALCGGLGLGDGHAVQVDEAGGVALRRHGAGHGHVVARPHQGPGRHPPPVPPRHRHRADHPRSHRHPGARHDQRHQAAARSKA